MVEVEAVASIEEAEELEEVLVVEEEANIAKGISIRTNIPCC